jgi:predicted DNA-binding protein YlxM (UPF0122 family)
VRSVADIGAGRFYYARKEAEDVGKAIKLTDKQVHMIVAASAGGATLREIAEAYGVSKDKIAKVLRENKDLKTVADNIKKESDQQEYNDLLDYFEKNRVHLAGRISKALDVPDEVFDASSLRDRGGFAKLVSELVLLMKRERDASGGGEDGGRRLEVVFVDNSKKEDGEAVEE